MATTIEGINFQTIPEIAEVLKATPKTVRAYIKQGKLKEQRIEGPLLIIEFNLNEFLKQNNRQKRL